MKKRTKKATVTKRVVKNGKVTYKVKNWSEYNRALKERGKVFFHIITEVKDCWQSQKTGGVGCPQKYSDRMIEAILTIGQIFHLPLRAAVGTFGEIIDAAGIFMDVPAFSTLCKRSKTLTIEFRVRNPRENLHIVADSSGIKVYGEGEWKVRQHGYDKRRTWVKIHCALDEATGDVVAARVTNKDTHDCAVLPELLNDIPTAIDRVSLDGAYDTRDCYHAIETVHKATPVIPPHKNARIRLHKNNHRPPLTRDTYIRRIREVGRATWKRETNYHRRSLAENGFFRYKTLFPPRIHNKLLETQTTTLFLRLKIMNRYTKLGMPVTERVGT